MRIIQLIDSLHPGGAERMAVSYANAFLKKEGFSYLCCTRQEGSLKAQILPEVNYLFLKKRNSLDLFAFWRLWNFIKTHNIEIIQAHGTSWFIATLLKIFSPGLKLVWHDHYGRDLKKRPVSLLKPFSVFFDGIISVNHDLEKWARNKLNVKNVLFVRNFLSTPLKGKTISLKGENGEVKIICLANFRPQKDHITLLKAFSKVNNLAERNISLHLVGKEGKDEYSSQIHDMIDRLSLENVHVYGEQQSIDDLLSEADIGVLSSASEGLPVALLEYGRAGLPVVCTRVGQCAEVLGDSGKLVPPGKFDELAEALLFYVKDGNRRRSDGNVFQQKVWEEFSEDKILPEVQSFFTKLNMDFSGQE